MMLRGEISIVVGSLALEVDLSLGESETLVIVGPNGAGKSTLLRAIAGLAPLDRGRLEIGDEVWDDPDSAVFVDPSERGIGMVFQSHALIAHLDARSNVAFGLRAHGMAKSAAVARADQLLDEMGVGDVAALLPRQLSGGQSQRVALARALAPDPRLLLLDEPLSALDARARSSMRRLLEHQRAVPRIIVTHDPVDALTLADRVMVLEGGRVAQTGRPSELIESPRSTYVAEILGLNPLQGVLVGNRLDVGATSLTVGAHSAADGPVIAVIRPRSISLHRERPEGSPRNVWSTHVAGVDRSMDRVRVRLDDPLPVTVEVTPAGLDALKVSVGDTVWASVKASEIAVTEG
jgi:molybdate transport system ATP-binding protein